MSQCDMPGVDVLAAARDADARGAWQEADELLDRCGAEARSAEGLELRARAAYGAGRFEACVSAWEDLHALLVAAADPVGAARAAAMIAMYLMMDTGLMAPVRGWLRRSEHLLEGHEETPAHALIAMVRTYERFMCGDMAAARAQSALAIELGERLGVGPAVVIGRVAAARVEIFDGRIDEGLERLDEVGAMLMAGEADPLTTGMMYCELICAAQGLSQHDRAAEWTEVMERWRHGEAIGGISGRCRVHRAELLRVSGPCDLAEAEALAACEELRPWMRREFGWPLAELGNIRLRKGDLDGADEAFRAAHDHAWSPQPGLALVHLARGDVAGAAAMIADAIAHPIDIPSKERPPFGDLRLAPLYDAQVEIAAAAGDTATAQAGAAALAGIAAAYPGRSLDAMAAPAAARAAALAGDLDEAITRCATAVALWTEVGAPFETAAARTALGHVYARAGLTRAATMEWTAAATAFSTFGARHWAERATALADSTDPNHPNHPTDPTRPAAPMTSADGRPTVATFRRTGDTRTISFEGLETIMRDLQGFRYVERLLREPGREFHVLDLIAVEHGTLRTHDAGLPVLDDEARAAYRRRLAEVEEDIDDATRQHDLGRLALAERDREYLIAELTAAVGLGGRGRLTGGSAERARTSVTRSIRYALGRLADHHPGIAAHLGANVRTGTYCTYVADPLATITWTV